MDRQDRGALLGSGNPQARQERAPQGLLEPAERCCECCGGGCNLLQGVRLIATYTAVNGFFAVFALLADRSAETAGQSQEAAAVESIYSFVQAFALIAGFQGMVGVILRSKWRLTMFFLYQIIDLLTRCLAITFRVSDACHELARLQEKGKLLQLDCHAVRTRIVVEFTIRTVLFTYFAFVTWSLVKRLETGELMPQTIFDEGYEMGDRAAFPDTLWGGGGGGRGDLNAVLAQQRLLAGAQGNSGGGGDVEQQRPFTGAPRTMAEAQPFQQQTMEPFRGTAHRLD